MAVTGVVREWHDEGWGVIDSPETPGGCWAHFSRAAVLGSAMFDRGDRVTLEWESPGQDGWPYRAVRFWPYGAEPAGRTRGPAGEGAYRSELTLTFDEPRDPD